MTTDTLPAQERHRLQNSAATSPPIDTEVLFSRCMRNVSFALTLLSELEANGKQAVDKILQHATDDDPLAVAEAAHSLKGASAIIGAESLRGMSAEIETAARAGETSRLLDMVHDLCSEMDRCLTYIPTVRNETQPR